MRKKLRNSALHLHLFVFIFAQFDTLHLPTLTTAINFNNVNQLISKKKKARYSIS